MMRGRVAWWGNAQGGFTVEFDQEMLSWLDGQGTDRRVFVSVSRERRIIVLPDGEGGLVISKDETGRQREHYYESASSRKGEHLFLDLELLPFGLTEVEFVEEEGCISAELPADHELAWPNVRADCTTYDAPLLLKEVLQSRMCSLVASGFTSFRAEHRMPIRLRQMLPDGAWAECLTTAKQLAGVS
jgi:hypothetical protein